MSETNDPAVSSGFLSEANKRTFTTVAGILGAVFFVVQVSVPIVAVFAMMPIMMLREGFETYEVDAAALHQGELYVVETAQSFSWEGPRGTRSRLVRPAGTELQEVLDLEGWEPDLLSDGDRLWFISSTQIGALVDGRLEPYSLPEPLGDICRPFLYQGAPAVIESGPDGGRLMSWREDRWEAVRALPEVEGGCAVQALSVDDSVWIFRRSGHAVYVQDTTAEEPNWNVVLSQVSQWFAFIMDGRPAVVTLSQPYGLRLVRYDGTRWTPTATVSQADTGFVGDVAAFQERPGDAVQILSSGFPGSLSIRTLGEQEFTSEMQFGRTSLFPQSFLWVMVLPHLAPMVLSLLLAIILTSLMHRHRVTIYEYQGRQVAYAPLIRRALSQIIDVLLLGLPGIFLWFRMFGDFTDFARAPGQPATILAMMGISLAWGIAGLVFYGVGEGLWGVTPGKWLLGIRVLGTDLAPCGIGRAIIRNVLKFVDGFFNYLVGILLVAFTPQWQRVGDLAARTIVVRVEPRP